MLSSYTLGRKANFWYLERKEVGLGVKVGTDGSLWMVYAIILFRLARRGGGNFA